MANGSFYSIQEISKSFILPLAGTVIAGYISIKAILPMVIEDVKDVSGEVKAIVKEIGEIKNRQALQEQSLNINSSLIKVNIADLREVMRKVQIHDYQLKSMDDKGK